MYIVIFTGGEAPEPELTENFFFAINNKFKTLKVIAADSGIETLIKYKEYFKNQINFTPDFICGDMDSIHDKKLLDLFLYAEKEIFPEYKDLTDTEIALKKAHNVYKEENENSENCIILVGGDGGRIDHILGVLETFNSPEKADFWLCSKQLAAFISDGITAKIEALKNKDAVSIYKLNEKENAYFKSNGLEWNEKVFRKSKMPSLSNQISQEYLENKMPVEITPYNTDCILFLPYTSYLYTSSKKI